MTVEKAYQLILEFRKLLAQGVDKQTLLECLDNLRCAVEELKQ